MNFLRVKEFAEAIGVSVNTLRSWDKDGKLKPDHRTAGGQRMYTQSQVEDYFKKDGLEREMIQRYPNEKGYIRSGEFAELIGVSPTTLRRWDDNGKLPAHHLSASGQRLYARKQAEDYFHGVAVNKDGFARKCNKFDFSDEEIDLFA